MGLYESLGIKMFNDTVVILLNEVINLLVSLKNYSRCLFWQVTHETRKCEEPNTVSHFVWACIYLEF